MLLLLTGALLALLGCFVCDAQLTSSKTSLPTTSIRIIGGTETQINKYPYLVSIERFANSNRWQHDCGGTIISTTAILTAAHCVSSSVSSPSRLRVRAGSAVKESGGQVRQVRQVIVHPRYNEDTDDYDVAVLLLASSLTYGAGVTAISIAPSGATCGVGEAVNIAGWGVTNTLTSATPTQLMETSLNLVSRESCRTIYRGIATITARMMCAYAANRDSCQGWAEELKYDFKLRSGGYDRVLNKRGGEVLNFSLRGSGDSGGPMVTASGVQIGIVSFGVGCAEPGYPGVYAKLAEEEINSFVLSFLRTTVISTTIRPIAISSTTAAPTTVRPTTVRPTTVRPTTVRPTTVRPTTVRPTTYRPTTVRPTTVRPTTVRPTTVRPTTVRPTTASPTTARPTAAPTTTQSSTTPRPPDSGAGVWTSCATATRPSRFCMTKSVRYKDEIISLASTSTVINDYGK